MTVVVLSSVAEEKFAEFNRGKVGDHLKYVYIQEGLWWLSASPKRLNAIRKGLCLGALATLLVALEGRVIFPAFGQYIQLHAPWNFIAVTIAVYGFAALALLYFGGQNSRLSA